MLNVTPQVAMAIAGAHEYCHLITLELTDGPIRLTDCGYPVIWQGNEFQSNGLLLGMDSPSFSTEIRIGEINLVFTAADQSIVALMLGTSQINRYVKMYRAYLDSHGA